MRATRIFYIVLLYCIIVHKPTKIAAGGKAGLIQALDLLYTQRYWYHVIAAASVPPARGLPCYTPYVQGRQYEVCTAVLKD